MNCAHRTLSYMIRIDRHEVHRAGVTIQQSQSCPAFSAIERDQRSKDHSTEDATRSSRLDRRRIMGGGLGGCFVKVLRCSRHGFQAKLRCARRYSALAAEFTLLRKLGCSGCRYACSHAESDDPLRALCFGRLPAASARCRESVHD